jgi:hypothetical protein
LVMCALQPAPSHATRRELTSADGEARRGGCSQTHVSTRPQSRPYPPASPVVTESSRTSQDPSELYQLVKFPGQGRPRVGALRRAQGAPSLSRGAGRYQGCALARRSLVGLRRRLAGFRGAQRHAEIPLRETLSGRKLRPIVTPRGCTSQRTFDGGDTGFLTIGDSGHPDDQTTCSRLRASCREGE